MACENTSVEMTDNWLKTLINFRVVYIFMLSFVKIMCFHFSCSGSVDHFLNGSYRALAMLMLANHMDLSVPLNNRNI